MKTLEITLMEVLEKIQPKQLPQLAVVSFDEDDCGMYNECGCGGACGSTCSGTCDDSCYGGCYYKCS